MAPVRDSAPVAAHSRHSEQIFLPGDLSHSAKEMVASNEPEGIYHERVVDRMDAVKFVALHFSSFARLSS